MNIAKSTMILFCVAWTMTGIMAVSGGTMVLAGLFILYVNSPLAIVIILGGIVMYTLGLMFLYILDDIRRGIL